MVHRLLMVGMASNEHCFVLHVWITIGIYTFEDTRDRLFGKTNTLMEYFLIVKYVEDNTSRVNGGILNILKLLKYNSAIDKT